MAKRGATDLSGILPIDKPQGMTSHDVVAVVREVTGERRVGHAGTLDPMATGVLVVLVGPATRLTPYLTGARKGYDARIVFGAETDTDDAEGAIVRTEAVPPELRTEEGAIAHVAELVGTHTQMPPAYSAIKKDGVVAHRAARSGNELELDPRVVEIADATLLGVEPETPVAWNISLLVSKGTYVRAIARDLGRELGTAAHLGGLRRTSSGSIALRRCLSLKAVRSMTPDTIASVFMPATEALEMPVIELPDAVASQVSVGRGLDARSADASTVADGDVALAHNGRLLAVYTKNGPALRPATVIPGGVA